MAAITLRQSRPPSMFFNTLIGPGAYARTNFATFAASNGKSVAALNGIMHVCLLGKNRLYNVKPLRQILHVSDSLAKICTIVIIVDTKIGRGVQGGDNAKNVEIRYMPFCSSASNATSVLVSDAH